MPLAHGRMKLGLLGVLTIGGGKLMNESVVALPPKVGLVPKLGVGEAIPDVPIGMPGAVVGMPGVMEPVMGAGVVIGGRLLLGTAGKPGPRTCPGAGVPAVLPIAVPPIGAFPVALPMPPVVCPSAAPASAANDTIHRTCVADRMAKISSDEQVAPDPRKRRTIS
jgi:hypothetical protein